MSVTSMQRAPIPKARILVLVPQDGEVGGTVGAPGHGLHALHVRRTFPDLAVQRTQDLSTDSQGGLARVERLHGHEELLQPLLLLLAGACVQFN